MQLVRSSNNNIIIFMRVSTIVYSQGSDFIAFTTYYRIAEWAINLSYEPGTKYEILFCFFCIFEEL